MATLNKTKQKEVEKAEGSEFDPIPAGVYHLRLRGVDTTRSGGAGPYWSWEFDVLHEDYGNRRLWNNTSLGEASAPFLKQMFDAFQAGYDTDTDDLIGKVVKAQVGVRTIQSGDRKGDLSNQISRLMPADDDFDASAFETKEVKPEDIF